MASFSWPSSISPSIGTVGVSVPASADFIGAQDPSGNLAPLKVDASGSLNVNIASVTLVSPLDVNLAKVGGASIALGQTTMSASLPVTIASNQSALPVSQSGAWTTGRTWTLSSGTDSVSVLQATASNLNATVVGTGTFLVQAAQSGTWNLNNISGTISLPTGAATAANQTNVQSAPGIPASTAITVQGNASGVALPISGSISITGTSDVNLIQVGGASIALGQAAMAASLPVVLASNQSAIPVSQSGTWTTGRTWTLSSGTDSVSVLQSTAASLNATVVGTGTFLVQAAQSGTWNINNISGTISLPTGASTAANQTNVQSSPGVSASTAITIQGNASGIAVPVSGSVSPVGTASANSPVYNDYSSTSISTSAYTQLVASTSNAINSIHIFDSSGQAMILAIGAVSSEVDTLYVPPGGDTYSLHIAAGSRISYKAKTATASSGFLLMSFLQ